MRLIFFVIAIFMLIAIFSCCFALRRRDTDLKNTLFFVNLSVFINCFLQLLSLLNLEGKFPLILNGLFYASTDWLLIWLTDYLFVFTGTPVKARSVVLFRKILIFVSAADTIFLLTNVFTGFSFDIFPCVIDRKFYCWNFKYHFGFLIHLLFCYFLALIIFYGLLKKLIITNKFYRGKFLAIFLIFILGISIKIIWFLCDNRLDISTFLYGIFAVFATYYSFYSEPKSVEAKMLRLVTENINNGVLCFDLNRKCIYANKVGKKFFADEAAAKNELENLLSEGKEFLFRDLEISSNGQKKVLSEEFYVIRDSNQLLLGYFIFFEDVTNELELLNQERFRSTHDLLTGLFNRSNFFLQAEKQLQANPSVPRYFVCTDIVNFKLVNDLFGAPLGDEILKKEADVLRELCSNESGSIIGRISNDRFALVVRKDKFNPGQAESKFGSLASFLSEYNYKIHFRVGIYEISNSYENVNSMYDKAELAMRKNEDLEKILSFYGPSMMKNLVEEKNVVSEFDKALCEGQFAMYLQPQVSSKNGEVAGAEALVRWIHPAKGVLYPNSFVPVLENAGLLYRLDLFIWEEAAKKLSEWKSRGINMHIAVNISAKDFYHLDLYEIFTGLVEKYGIEAEKLKLEITETVFMHDIKLHMQVLSKLQNFGFFIEMDDFGSGYSSLNMLKNLTFDILKIDMFFLSQPKNTEKSKLILNRIIKMAKKLGLTVISEGVENDENAEFLKKAGCDYFQGYLYSKPVTVSVFEKKFIGQSNVPDLDAGGNS